METKICTKCSEEKPVEEFSKDKSRKDGHCPQCKICRSQYYENNKVRISAKKKEYQTKNKVKLADYWKDYGQENKEELSEYRKVWRSNNKKSVSAYSKQWSLVNRDKRNAANARRNALKKDLTAEKVCYRTIRERDNACYLCLVPFTSQERWDGVLTHIDHKIPLSRTELNPTHSYENCALTHKKCNLQKHDKTPDEYWTHLATR